MAEKQPKNVSKINRREEVVSSFVTTYPDQTDLKRIGRSDDRHYLYLLTDAILQIVGSDEACDYLQQISLYNILLNMFSEKYPLKILYTLYSIKFSSVNELSSKTHLRNKSWIKDFLFRLEELSLVHKLSTDTHDYEIIKSFWRDEYKYSPRLPVMFCLSPTIFPVIKLLSDKIISKYFTKQEINSIFIRQRNYSIYKAKIENQLKHMDINYGEKIGECIKCGVPIRMKPDDDSHFMKAGEIYACKTCWRNASKTEQKKWLMQTK